MEATNNCLDMLRKKMKHSLKLRKSREYLSWIAINKDRRLDGHHIVGKRCDFLIQKIRRHIHLAKPYSDFDDQLIDALENLFDYVEYLEKNKKE